MKRTVLAALLAMGAVAAILAPARADVADDVYPTFQARDYRTVFNTLFEYRVREEGTLRVDFMLGVSACQFNSVEHRALGGYLLAKIPAWYGPLSQINRHDVTVQGAACPLTRMSESEAIAGIRAKSDTQGPDALDTRKSKSGAGDRLPSAPPAPPPANMSPLLLSQGYKAGHDYTSAPAVSAYQCQVLCSGAPRCKAMTWIDSQKLCWLKDALSPLAPTSDMTSSRKLP